MTRASLLDKMGRHKGSSVVRWSGWNKFTCCDNCGKNRTETRIHKVKMNEDQWLWMGGKASPDAPVVPTVNLGMNRTITVDLCEVCLFYVKERGPQYANPIRILKI